MADTIGTQKDAAAPTDQRTVDVADRDGLSVPGNDLVADGPISVVVSRSYVDQDGFTQTTQQTYLLDSGERTSLGVRVHPTFLTPYTYTVVSASFT